MSIIRFCSTVDSVVSSDKVHIYSSENGDDRTASLDVVADFIKSVITSVDNMVTQYFAPSATGFTATVNNDSNSTWLVITPTAGFAAGTVTLPASTVCVDRQEILINCTQSITTLSINGNGATVTGAPSTMTANGFFRLRFDGVTKTWYRVG